MVCRIVLILLSLITFQAVGATNPVTKQNEIHLVSKKREIELGQTYYPYGQQNGQGLFLQDPELSSYVNSVGQKLAKHGKRPDLPYEFVILNSSVPNAWALPGGKIAINRGLLVELQSEAELAAVLGHEITHAAARHGAQAVERQVLLTTGLVITNVALHVLGSNNHDLTNNAIMLGGQVAAQMVSTKHSRIAELEADAYGIDAMIKAGYNPEAAVSLQETFVRLHHGKSPNWAQGLFASHPPSEQRVAANRAKASKLKSASLETGTERYQAKMAHLKTLMPAYEAYDEGKKAFNKRKYGKAMQLNNQAITLAPKEALFYGLKGDLLLRSKLHQDALNAYNTAIALDDNYYYYYQQRGKLYVKMKQYKLARADLKRSHKLLPTKQSQQRLNELSH